MIDPNGKNLIFEGAGGARSPRWRPRRRLHGVPYVRFVINRVGRVPSSRLERPLGHVDLDREAVTLPKRAEPLPKPPEDRSCDTIELACPWRSFATSLERLLLSATDIRGWRCERQECPKMR
ncbi:energy transducer TonB [Novosphingobium panipatense]|uniref:energy transducer TonB family protein n=1 Tax=Novosphingobium panipatense TaxID=428991 RepID=UPI0039A3E8D0